MIYLDNHATTPCDPRVAERMIPWLTERFGNPHSTSHQPGREAKSAIDSSLESIGGRLGVAPDAIVVTSGATESVNLAIDGVCRHPRQKRRHVVCSEIEHPAVLDVVARLESDGFRVSRIPVHPQGHVSAGQIDLDRLASAVDDETALVSVHWANNEIGVVQPIAHIAEIAHARGALMHSDATQAVGRIDVDLRDVDVDLVSASAHKLYGPKGVGILTTRSGNTPRRVRLKPMIVGGGQQHNLRSGTLSPPLVVGFAAALELALAEADEIRRSAASLRDRLWQGLCDRIETIELNGPPLNGTARLGGNLNCRLKDVEGEAWMAATPGVAFSSGSACSSVEAKPSHVLSALGLSESQARRSVRFGVGRFNSAEQIDAAVEQLAVSYAKLKTASAG